MDLLEENKKLERTNTQKIILLLLITAVILLIFIVGTIIFVSTKKTKVVEPTVVKINDEEVKYSEDLFKNTVNNQLYIELKELSKLLGYDYYNGAYLEFSEEKDKCYIDKKDEIVGFENGNKSIYKINKIGKQIYELKNELIYENDKLYINKEDLSPALNVLIENNSINTLDFYAKKYGNEVSKYGYNKIDSESANLKAIAYNMIVVIKDNNKGIVDRQFKELVGTKYNTMEFVEMSQDFIVSSNGKYGIIQSNGDTKARLIYDELKILSYSPLLYLVKYDDKYGVLDSEGKIVVNTLYDKIGFDESKELKREATLIIPQMIDEIGNTIVVQLNNKYGLIDINRKMVVLDCIFDAIYMTKDNDEEEYIAILNGNEYRLIDYLKYAKIQIQNVGD